MGKSLFSEKVIHLTLEARLNKLFKVYKTIQRQRNQKTKFFDIKYFSILFCVFMPSFFYNEAVSGQEMCRAPLKIWTGIIA